MIQSYFFIPANKQKFVIKARELEADNYIFDMEESVCSADLDICLKNLRMVRVQDNFWVRIPIDYTHYESLVPLVQTLYHIGFRNILLPKIESSEQLRAIKETLHAYSLKFGILVESPRALLNFYEMATQNPDLSLVLIGSHDYCNVVGCKHEESNLIYLRQKLLTECKALSIPIVDYVSTNFADMEKYSQECVNANNMGFEGKAIIHPKQLEVFNHVTFYTKDEVAEAQAVMNELGERDIREVAIFKVNEKLYENPHIKRLKEIVEWNKNKKLYGI